MDTCMITVLYWRKTISERKIDIDVISSINRKINSHIPLPELLRAIMDVAKDLLNSEGSSLLLSDKKTGDLIFNIVIGEKGNVIMGEKVPYGKGIAGTVARTKEPMIVDDAQNDSRFFSIIDKKSSFNTRNILCVPMEVMGEFVGVLEIVNSMGRNRYDKWDLEKALYIADVAAVAINSRQLYNELNRRFEELSALFNISQSITYFGLVDDIFQKLIESIAESLHVKRASIIFFDEKEKKLRVESHVGLPDQIRRGHVINTDDTISGYVFTSGDPMIVSDIESEVSRSLRRDEGRYDTSSFISIPIMFKNTSLGVLNLSDKIDGSHFDSHDLRVLSTVSNHIGEASQNLRTQMYQENQKRLEREIDIAAEIQRKLLPGIPSRFKDHELYAFNKPAKEIGGDFYDYVPLDDEKYAVLVADISGKGIPAALFMGTAMNIVRAERRITSNPSGLLNQANDFIFRDSEYGMFVTLFYAVVDTRNRIISYGSAGHNNQLLIRCSSGKPVKLNADGKALGLVRGLNYEERKIDYEEGDILILFTDGVTEWLSEDKMDIEYGEDRLINIALEFIDRKPAEMVEHLKQTLEADGKGDDFRDDFTVFVIQF